MVALNRIPIRSLLGVAVMVTSLLAMACSQTPMLTPTATSTMTPTITPTPEVPREVTGTIILDCETGDNYGTGPECTGTLPNSGYIALGRVTQIDTTSPFDVPSYRILTIATGRLLDTSRDLPVQFSITYDAADIVSEADYAVVVWYGWSRGFGTASQGVDFGNNLGYSNSPTHVLTKGNPSKDVEVKIDRLWIIS